MNLKGKKIEERDRKYLPQAMMVGCFEMGSMAIWKLTPYA